MSDDTRNLYHSGDPDSSKTAAERATNRSAVKNAILEILGTTGEYAAFELTAIYARRGPEMDWPIVQPHSIPRRLSELHNAGLVEPTGVQVPTPWGRNAMLWRRTR